MCNACCAQFCNTILLLNGIAFSVSRPHHSALKKKKLNTAYYYFSPSFSSHFMSHVIHTLRKERIRTFD